MITKNIQDSWNDCLKEARFEGDSNLIENVAVMSSPISRNGYTYSQQAVNRLAQMVNGAKAYLDHPSREKARNTDNVRSIRDWAGVFSRGRRHMGGVKASLQIRPVFMPLFRDIINMGAGLGFSINARVFSTKDQKGREGIADIEKLISVDLVTSPATNQSLLFEAFGEDMQEEYEVVKKGIYESLGLKYSKPEKETDYEKAKSELVNTLMPHNSVCHYGDDFRIKQTTKGEESKKRFLRLMGL